MKKEKQVSLLEEKLMKKAELRFKKDMRDFAEMVGKSPIMRNLKIKYLVDDNQKEVLFMNHNGQTGNVLFNSSSINDAVTLTNINEIKTKIINKYKEEETDKLLSSMEEVGYILRQQYEQ